MAQDRFYATGKRKSAIARVWLTPGSGKLLINEIDGNVYFAGMYKEQKINKPFEVTATSEQYDVVATLRGGGKSAQAEALCHGISKALLSVNPDNRTSLKRSGLLTRDARIKERKKYGQKAARAKFQFSKR